MKKHIGLISFIPAFIASLLLSRFIPHYICIALFVLSFFIFFFTKKHNQKYKSLFTLNFLVMIFCSLHFWAYCVTEFDFTEYDSFYEERNAIGLSWIFYLPLSFTFSFIASLLFDRWRKIKN
ncbi:MAG: hypothetical protein EOO87_02690 [Pedobacter sp.]|nr:MAG: hypothetical protein EOO87_02690 [Pedobacter sp.]